MIGLSGHWLAPLATSSAVLFLLISCCTSFVACIVKIQKFDVRGGLAPFFIFLCQELHGSPEEIHRVDMAFV